MLYAQETWIDRSGNCILGESEVYETWCETPGQLYRAMQQEYGRCTGKVGVDKDGHVLNIGWVFVKRQKYADCPETYLQETWVTVHEKPPTKTTEYHYLKG